MMAARVSAFAWRYVMRPMTSIARRFLKDIAVGAEGRGRAESAKQIDVLPQDAGTPINGTHRHRAFGLWRC